MPTAENAILYFEAGQTPTGMTLLTDQGDLTEFKSAVTLWSNRSGYEPSVKPNGLATGGTVSVAASASNDVVDVAALTCYLAGVLTAVGASTDLAIARPVLAYQKQSITVTALGALAVVEGTEHASAFSLTRGAAGGPPWIDNDAIEIAQIWYTSATPAVVLASEIKQVRGVTQEHYSYPTWQVQYVDVENGVLGYAGVTFDSALDGIHSEDAGTTVAGKLVYASYNEPTFAEIVDAFDFVPPVNAHTVASTQVYGRTKGSKSSSLNQGSFSAELQDGVSDGFMQFDDEELWFKFKPDRLKTPYILCQGKLGIGQTFPAGSNIQAACTISADVALDRVYS
jgi:hypothetical protein